MSSKHKKLGTLADIFQAESLDGTITRIRLDRIHPSEEQPRKDRTLGVDELAESIKKDGLLSPIVVTRAGEGYRIIAGERRFHALNRLGWKEAECRIISREERDYYRIAIIENLQRENLSAQEEAEALLRLKQQENYSDAELAQLVGKSRNYITEILGIAGLPPEALKRCKEAGLENKNLLIQAVQAHRKNRFEDFLSAYESGSIRTVRSAREFFSEGATPENPQPGRTSDNKQPAEKKTDSEPDNANRRTISRKGSIITIDAGDARAAKSLESWLRKNIQTSTN
ncbi:MAG TPA: chromosome partitioning protein ParB [Leptospiraceae bacterium]|nr:chromosome partitioning protein ParB [Leptospiraceae bacterium]